MLNKNSTFPYVHLYENNLNFKSHFIYVNNKLNFQFDLYISDSCIFYYLSFSKQRLKRFYSDRNHLYPPDSFTRHRYIIVNTIVRCQVQDSDVRDRERKRKKHTDSVRFCRGAAQLVRLQLSLLYHERSTRPSRGPRPPNCAPGKYSCRCERR